MEEYLVLQKGLTQLQKALNQWRHDYDLEIIHTHIFEKQRTSEELKKGSEPLAVVLLKRTPKNSSCVCIKGEY